MSKVNNIPIHVLLITLGLIINVKSIKAENITVEISTKKELSNQSNDPILFIKNFFKWYKTKFDYLDHHIYTVKMDTIYTPYRVDFKAVDKYLFILKSSGYFSDNYIKNYRNYYKKIDLILQKTKQNDGEVDGLDYDPIVHSQEPENILANLKNTRFSVEVSAMYEINVKVQTPYDVNTYMFYHLIKANNKYLINKIDFYVNGKVQ